MKRNKIRYQSADKNRPTLILTGKSHLRFRDAETPETLKKGDAVFYPKTEKLPIEVEEDYHCLGWPGMFKVDVFDGYALKPIVMNDMFPEREHHFSKHELPIDVFTLCEGLWRAFKGVELVRTYREHYERTTVAAAPLAE